MPAAAQDSMAELSGQLSDYLMTLVPPVLDVAKTTLQKRFVKRDVGEKLRTFLSDAGVNGIFIAKGVSQTGVNANEEIVGEGGEDKESLDAAAGEEEDSLSVELDVEQASRGSAALAVLKRPNFAELVDPAKALCRMLGWRNCS